MKNILISFGLLCLLLISCNPSSQNQGYDSGPTTRTESGSSGSSEGGMVKSDSTDSIQNQ